MNRYIWPTFKKPPLDLPLHSLRRGQVWRKGEGFHDRQAFYIVGTAKEFNRHSSIKDGWEISFDGPAENAIVSGYFILHHCELISE